MSLNTTNNSGTATKPHFILPFTNDEDFIDRPAIWNRLTELYEGSSSRIALVGLGGTGYASSIHRVRGSKLNVHKEVTNCYTFWAAYPR